MGYFVSFGACGLGWLIDAAIVPLQRHEIRMETAAWERMMDEEACEIDAKREREAGVQGTTEREAPASVPAPAPAPVLPISDGAAAAAAAAPHLHSTTDIEGPAATSKPPTWAGDTPQSGAGSGTSVGTSMGGAAG